MKLYKILLTAITIITLGSCNTLDVEPLNIVSDSDVFESESGVTAYMARLYRDARMDDFATESLYSLDHYTDLMDGPGYNITGYSVGDDSWGWWDYTTVREINYFIEEFPQYAINHTESNQNVWIGECYFLRAWAYFAMCKRYGGIPIVDHVIEYNTGDDIEALMMPRDKEEDVLDFILEDIDRAIALFENEPSPSEGRANEYAAYAFKARVALYAASIAKYGTPLELSGDILGVSASSADSYYNIAYSAAAKVISDGGYSLYSVGSYEDYVNIFIDESSNENIYLRKYSYPDYAHSIELMAVPWSYRGADNYSSRWCPTVNYLSIFTGTDGKSLDPSDSSSSNYIGPYSDPVSFDSRSDIYAKADYRLMGTVLFSGSEFKEREVDVKRGIYDNGEYTFSNEDPPGSNYKNTDVKITGADGLGSDESTSTGLYIRKWLNPDTPIGEISYGRSETSWIELRLGEVYLMCAEAAVELGDADKLVYANTLISELRSRAGAYDFGANYLTADDAGVENIRAEWAMETMAENKMFWNYKRWRVFHTKMDNFYTRKLCPWYDINNDKWMFREEKSATARTFQTKNYYLKVPQDEINKNTLLVQNPGY